MEAGNMINTQENEQALPDIIENNALRGKKPSFFARIKNHMDAKKAEKDFLKVKQETRQSIEETKERDMNNFMSNMNNFRSNVESHFGNLDESNKLLLLQISTLKEDNKTLLEEVKILRVNNELLNKQFQISKRREKVSKIIAVISSVLAIGLTIYKFLQVFHIFP